MYQTKIIYRGSSGVNIVHSEEFPQINANPDGTIAGIRITPAGPDKVFIINTYMLEDIRSVQVTELQDKKPKP